MIANSQAAILLEEMTKLNERVNAALKRLKDSAKQGAENQLQLEDDAVKILDLVEQLAKEISIKVDLLRGFASAPNLSQVFGVPLDEYKTFVGYAEDWATRFEEGITQALQAPHRPLN